MKKNELLYKTKTIMIAIILILTVFTMNVEAKAVQNMYAGLLKAFALSAPETNETITIIDSSYEYNEEKENYTITLDVETEEIVDGTALNVELQAYSLENELLRRRSNIYSNR